LLAVLLLLTLVAALSAGTTQAAASDDGCQTSFLVFTDPNNRGDISQRGQVTIARDSGVLGQYTSGRLDGYAINGLQDLIVNTVTNEAQIHGSFTATSPDGASSLMVRYSGHADLNTGIATGTFAASGGTGDFDGYRASGKIEATLVGPATFEGVDIGLC
jgi:hypothetical protein